MQIGLIESSLTKNITEYHNILEKIGYRLYMLYQKNPRKAAYFFLRTVVLPRSIFLDFLAKKGLNYGSIAGIISEWYFYHMINTVIKAERLKDLNVYNGYRLPFKWKKKGNKETVIDIAVWLQKPRRLIYCVEVKKNFEDGFSKYYKEQNIIYHHRTKGYKDFKYHYVAFSEIPKYIFNNYKSKIDTLKRRQQLWVFPSEKLVDNLDKALIGRARKFLGFLYNPLLEFK